MTQPRHGKQGNAGAPRKKGARQPNLAARLDDPTTVWTEHTVAWYGRTTRKVRLATGTALWYHSGMAPVTLRWVLIADLADADPATALAPQALLCTDCAVAARTDRRVVCPALAVGGHL